MFASIKTILLVVLSLGSLQAIPLTNVVNGNAKRMDSTVKFEKKSMQWDYKSEKIQGVNLGGWFVLEPYITPSLFYPFPADNIPVDEYHYTQYLGQAEAYNRLSQHWSTWHTEDDFEQIAAAGLNFVRIPIGYWAFQLLDNDPYVQGQESVLDQALGWAANHGLKVWIDLHGAPGSQNGFDNSGLRDQVGFQSGNNVQVTLSVLEYIMEKYGGSDYEDVVIGIELLNEPLGPVLDMNNLKDFYVSGYNQLRALGDQAVIIHDAFQASGYWDDFLLLNDYWNVVVDHHHYQVFSAGELQRDINAHISVACQYGSDASNEYHWSITGEWSAALTDCAPLLNGVYRGARFEGQYDGSPYIGDCAPYLSADAWTPEIKTNYRKYIEAQLDSYSSNGGWVFWCWKTESAIEWDFQKLAAAGVFPQPLSDRQYPNQCGF